MIDREKVIRGLECRSNNAIGRDCENCPYGIQMARRWGCDFLKLAYDALALLKEQDAAKKCCPDCEYYFACHSDEGR